MLKVLDFGLSSGPEELKLARLAGTLSYMAPELLCSQTPSTSSDLYAVGLVAYELFTGEHPFAREDAGVTRLLFKVLRELPDLSRLPGALGAVVGRALSKRPEDRPPDVATLLRELCHTQAKPSFAVGGPIGRTLPQDGRRRREVFSLQHGRGSQILVVKVIWTLIR